MTEHELAQSRHPLCTCEERPGFPWGLIITADCRGGAGAHPVLDVGDPEVMRQILAPYKRHETPLQ